MKKDDRSAASMNLGGDIVTISLKGSHVSLRLLTCDCAFDGSVRLFYDA